MSTLFIYVCHQMPSHRLVTMPQKYTIRIIVLGESNMFFKDYSKSILKGYSLKRGSVTKSTWECETSNLKDWYIY